ncbi:MAG: FAD-linked oxidase C-terminal domain-containing protein [Pyrinomonadaceae bacterium]
MDELIRNLRATVGRDAVLAEADELLVYECDGLPQHKHLPRAVVFPRSTEETAEVLRVLNKARVPFAPRGAGTGLSGGALAQNRGVLIEMAQMRRLLELDVENRTAIVETGFVNAQLTRAAAPHNLYYAPDPSSQATCTIGGNIAENAGGIHCLKYGMTVDHVLAARVVLADGHIVDLHDDAAVEKNGFDLLGVFIGSEGTFGIATEATLRLLQTPPAVRTLLADFTNVDDASRAVSAIIAAGIIPAALEMIDGVTIRAVEASIFAAGIPQDALAALLIEVDGLEAGLDAETAQAENICRQYGARDVRRANGEAERKKLWAARKGAFGAMGRLAPDLMLQDAVVPRSRLPEVLAATYRIGAKYKLLVANVFHAGDGNLHPFICFDSRNADEVKRVKEAGREIMETCVRAGGTITGEHGVGLDKSAYLPLIFSEDDMDAMLRVRAAFDPTGLCNPGKIIPTMRSCGEARTAKTKQAQAQTNEALTQSESYAHYDAASSQNGSATPQESAHAPTPQKETFASVEPTLQDNRAPFVSRSGSFNPAAARALFSQLVGAANISEAEDSETLTIAPATVREACEAVRLAAREGWRVQPAGARTWLNKNRESNGGDVVITTRHLTRIIEHEPADLTATTEAGVPLVALNAELARRGKQWLPLDPPGDGRATVGGITARGDGGGAQSFYYGRTRSFVIGMRVALADGKIIKAGGRVVKNVAGYDMCKLFVGSRGALGLILELTFKLRPLPAQTTTVIARGSLSALLPAARGILDARLFPVALELLSPRMAHAVALPQAGAEDCALLIRFAGSAEAVAYQTQQSCVLLNSITKNSAVETCADDDELWRELAANSSFRADQINWRANVRPTELGALLNFAASAAPGLFNASSLWHAGAGDGRVRVCVSSQMSTAMCAKAFAKLNEAARRYGGALRLENAPFELWNACAAHNSCGAAAGLSARIKQQLDPANLFCA